MKADGIEGTPSLVIDGETHQNMSYEDLKSILDAKLAG
jgi:protein-disulfide isomerase